MPLPEPNKENQEKEDFVNLCMDDLKMVKEFPNDEQRAAVCYSQWDKAKAKVKEPSEDYSFDWKGIDATSFLIDLSNKLKNKNKKD